jgi:hypothetical protein
MGARVWKAGAAGRAKGQHRVEHAKSTLDSLQPFSPASLGEQLVFDATLVQMQRLGESGSDRQKFE